jgi:membrane protease YdiL (CAAX protease family)
LLVERHGLWIGIILASASFVLLHLLIAQFTVIALLASILLACLYGILYIWTDSIFLVGAMHTTFNLASRLLGQWPSDISLLIVNGLILIMVFILYLRVVKVSHSTTC